MPKESAVTNLLTYAQDARRYSGSLNVIRGRARIAHHNPGVLNTWRFINDAVTHPVGCSDDFIVERAVRLLRNG